MLEYTHLNNEKKRQNVTCDWAEGRKKWVGCKKVSAVRKRRAEETGSVRAVVRGKKRGSDAGASGPVKA